MQIIGFRQVPVGWRMLARDRIRFAITLAGVGVAVALMLFLAAVYEGVRTESNGYVEGRPVDVWIAQGNATNLVRSSSFLSTVRWGRLNRADGVASLHPLLRLITTLKVNGKVFTAFVCGVDPGAPATHPAIVEGPGTLHKGEIIVDWALAKRAGLRVGDPLFVQGRAYRVSGISSGTNVIISQFTFVALDDAQELLGMPNVVSFLLVTGRPGVTPQTLSATLRHAAPELNVFTADEFITNNLDELRTGLLPILATIAVFGAVIGAAVVTLLLYGAILERREDYAVLKAIGANAAYIRLLVLRQSIATVACGFAAGLLLYAVSQPVIASLVPIFVTALTPLSAAVIGEAVVVMGMIGALIPLARLERIHPAEAFRP